MTGSRVHKRRAVGSIQVMRFILNIQTTSLSFLEEQQHHVMYHRKFPVSAGRYFLQKSGREITSIVNVGSVFTSSGGNKNTLTDL